MSESIACTLGVYQSHIQYLLADRGECCLIKILSIFFFYRDVPDSISEDVCTMAANTVWCSEKNKQHHNVTQNRGDFFRCRQWIPSNLHLLLVVFHYLTYKASKSFGKCMFIRLKLPQCSLHTLNKIYINNYWYYSCFIRNCFTISCHEWE